MEGISLDPYIFFTGQAEEAIKFYHGIFGGELAIQKYSEVPGDAGLGKDRERMKDKVMHSHIKGGLVSLMASDGTRQNPYPPSFISLSLGGSDEEKLRDIFAKLSEGGEVTSALKKEFWGDTFGTVTDKFGVEWMVNITGKEAEA